jgi:hypothetical protein
MIPPIWSSPRIRGFFRVSSRFISAAAAIAFTSKNAAARIAKPLRRPQPIVTGDLAVFCGKPLLELGDLISFGSIGLIGPLTQGFYAVTEPAKEKTPAGTRVFSVSLLLGRGAC